MTIKNIALIILCLTAPLLSWGQYYDWGNSPSSIKWQKIKSENTTILAPNYYTGAASRVLQVMDSVRNDISYGYTFGPMKIPVVLHTQNFHSNGIVILAPKRMELIMSPLGSSSATPWYKQLTVHEYRHAVQYENSNKHLIKLLSYIFGQQGTLVGTLLFPMWLLEGDAVLAETQMTSYGRGLQPSFTLELRAMAKEKKRYISYDKYICGSYKNYMPDHYQVGYQMASFADNKYKENIANKLVDFSTKYPFTIFTSYFSLRKYYDITASELLWDTLDDLSSYWSSVPTNENSSTFVKIPKVKSYTIYSAPTIINDSTIIALKSTLNKNKHIVTINTKTGNETIKRYIGNSNSDPVLWDNKLYWSEYRNSTIWEQRVGSIICTYDLKSNKTDRIIKIYNALYPAPSDNGIAYVEPQDNGAYKIIGTDKEWNFPLDIELHGLAYDQTTNLLYFLALDQSGMWIGRCNNDETYSQLTKGSFSTLSRLSANSGRLIFNSIQSGLDEIHMYDLATNKEWQVSRSTFGSFGGTAKGDTLAMTTYASSTSGYLPSTQKINLDSITRVEHSVLPQNKINPPRIKWDVVNIDKVHIDTLTTQNLNTKRYRKGLNLFNVHSWAPMSYNADEIIDNQKFNIYAGATIVSQNLLSSMSSQFSYGWTGSEGGSMVNGAITYTGLAPKFKVEATYGGANQYISGRSKTVTFPTSIDKYLDVRGQIYLPLTLSSGHIYRYLTPSIEIYYDNTLFLNQTEQKYDEGFGRTTASLQYSANSRMAYRELRPKLGYGVGVSYTTNPINSNIGSVYSLNARGYLPGFVRPHSLMLRVAANTQTAAEYNYVYKTLYPRGATLYRETHQYAAVSADYAFPVCYPDIGIPGIVYFKRITMNLTGDYAKYNDFDNLTYSAWSYGAEITFEINPISLPASTKTSITINIYKPSDRNGVVAGCSLILPI